MVHHVFHMWLGCRRYNLLRTLEKSYTPCRRVHSPLKLSLLSIEVYSTPDTAFHLDLSQNFLCQHTHSIPDIHSITVQQSRIFEILRKCEDTAYHTALHRSSFSFQRIHLQFC